MQTQAYTIILDLKTSLIITCKVVDLNIYVSVLKMLAMSAKIIYIYSEIYLKDGSKTICVI